ncbi:MAG: hypothetical protein A2096_01055 [Spirochaetes bacterium GWF1_41_5]|nr:MAG: hypothetical protein A2096_01055 [Spirochaetes bacterium GWF1_41_5]HBE04169.1 hypothetical protein [Spirochaetia bacterium]
MLKGHTLFFSRRANLFLLYRKSGLYCFIYPKNKFAPPKILVFKKTSNQDIIYYATGKICFLK